MRRPCAASSSRRSGSTSPTTGTGPCVGHRRHVFDVGGGYDGQEEWFYPARVDAFEPRGALTAEQLVAEGLVEIRWMTPAEVHTLPDETSGEPVFLRAGAAAFTARLVEHGHPDAPVELAFWAAGRTVRPGTAYRTRPSP